MNKEIYFCVDEGSFQTIKSELKNSNIMYCEARSYGATKILLNETRGFPIITMSIAHLSFDLINDGYDIYLCYHDKKVKIEPHMDLSGIGEPGKDLKFGHNIFKLFRAGVFDRLLGIEKGGKQ